MGILWKYENNRCGLMSRFMSDTGKCNIPHHLASCLLLIYFLIKITESSIDFASKLLWRSFGKHNPFKPAYVKRLLITQAEKVNWNKHLTLCNFYNSEPFQTYCKIPKYLDTQKFWCNYCKIWTRWLLSKSNASKGAEGIANSVDPD